MNKRILMLAAMAVTFGVFAQLRMPRSASASAAPAAPAAAPAAGKSEMKEAPALNWEQAPVDIVLQAYGEQIGKTVLKDPGTPNATISLKSREGQKLSQEEYLEAIEVVLEMNGVHLEPYGEKFIRAIPRAKARKIVGMAVYMSIEDVPKTTKEGTVISVRLTFRYIGTEEAQKALEGFKSDSGLLQIFERTNSILVTDTWENIRRMDEVIRSIDIDTPVLENVYVRQIKNASAQDIKTALEAIVQESQKEMEKNKTANNANVQANNANRFANPLLPGNRLLNRNQPQQPAAVNNESLVMSVSDADRGMIRGKVLILADERSNKLIIVTQKTNMDFFDKVIEQLDVETTPDTVVKVYRLKYADAEEVSDMINDLIGNAAASKSAAKGNQNANARNGTNANVGRTTTGAAQKKSVNQRSGDAKAGELSKDNTTVLADKRINGLVVMTEKDLVKTLESIIESMDVKLSQVLIETVIVEVQLGNGIEMGIDWVQNGRYQGNLYDAKLTDSLGRQLYYPYAYDSETGEYSDSVINYSGTPVLKGEAGASTVEALTKLTKDALWSGNSGFAQIFGGGANNGSTAADIVSGMATNVFGSALNYVFKSDKLNLSAIIQATKTDNRAKYIASPIVMTVDNKEATIEATQARKFLSNYQTSSSYYGSTPAPQYENKDIGIKIKVTPKINPNGTVMLEIEEEYSQVGAKQSILDPSSKPVSIDTSLTRKMSADALLENNQTVVLCGLTETKTDETLTGIPILMDIPYIGKWLFSKVSESEVRSELLIFMTPYVLTDGESAQAEALRRKQALSDPRPWEDHGWSKSALADPVSAKEQLRKQKEEWKKLDEEHAAAREIEKAKSDRVKKLLERMQEEAERDARRQAMEKSE